MHAFMPCNEKCQGGREEMAARLREKKASKKVRG
jgi:hypothetical protein